MILWWDGHFVTSALQWIPDSSFRKSVRFATSGSLITLFVPEISQSGFFAEQQQELGILAVAGRSNFIAVLKFNERIFFSQLLASLLSNVYFTFSHNDSCHIQIQCLQLTSTAFNPTLIYNYYQLNGNKLSHKYKIFQILGIIITSSRPNFTPLVQMTWNLFAFAYWVILHL